MYAYWVFKTEIRPSTFEKGGEAAALNARSQEDL